MTPSPNRRAIALALARFVVVLGLLVAPWPGLARTFTDAVGTVATAIADPFFTSSNVTFRLRSPVPAEQQPEGWGVIEVKQDFPEGPKRHAGAIDLRRVGYLQVATFIALAAGWPPRGGRRWARAALAVGAIVAATIAVPILDYLGDVGVIHMGAFIRGVVALVRRALVAAPGMAYAIPGLTWLALSQATPDAPGPRRGSLQRSR